MAILDQPVIIDVREDADIDRMTENFRELLYALYDNGFILPDMSTPEPEDLIDDFVNDRRSTPAVMLLTDEGMFRFDDGPTIRLGFDDDVQQGGRYWRAAQNAKEISVERAIKRFNRW